MPHATFVLSLDRDEPPAQPLTRSEADPHAWAMEQAGLMRLGRFHDLDIDNLADEVQGVARRESDTLESDLTRVMQHCLNRRLPEALGEAYRRGRAEALIETDLPEGAIPDWCLQTWDEVMARPIAWPEP